jgi:hypothetical protein
MRYRLRIDEVGHANFGASLVNENERYLTLIGVAFGEGYMRDLVYPAMDRLRTQYFRHLPNVRRRRRSQLQSLGRHFPGWLPVQW